MFTSSHQFKFLGLIGLGCVYIVKKIQKILHWETCHVRDGTIVNVKIFKHLKNLNRALSIQLNMVLG